MISVTRFRNKKVPKNNPQHLLSKSDAFQDSPKFHKYFGYFLKKICHEQISQIAQSAHDLPCLEDSECPYTRLG